MNNLIQQHMEANTQRKLLETKIDHGEVSEFLIGVECTHYNQRVWMKISSGCSDTSPWMFIADVFKKAVSATCNLLNPKIRKLVLVFRVVGCQILNSYCQ